MRLVKFMVLIGMVLTIPAWASPKTQTSGGASHLGDNLGVAGQDIAFTASDPRLPGKFLYKIWARGIDSQSGQGTSLVKVTGVTVYLYQKGTWTARITTPNATADSASQSITARGRVFVYSQTEPGTVLEADQVIWNHRTNQIDASGNVVYHNAKNGVSLRGPHFIGNTALGTIRSAGPGHARFR